MVLEKVFYKIISTINVNTWNAHRDLVGIITLQIMIIIIIIIFGKQWQIFNENNFYGQN